MNTSSEYELNTPLNGQGGFSNTTRRGLAAVVSLAVSCFVVGVAVGSRSSVATTPVLSASATPPPKYSPVGKSEKFRKKLIFEDDFDTLDFDKWRHELTMGGGGNWEFEWYTNNRTNSFARNGTLHLHATLTADQVGEELVEEGGTLDLWGATPASQCTTNAFFGCYRTSGAGGNMINPIQSAKLRTFESFNFKYGRMEVRAKLPRGDWLWPAVWLLPKQEIYGQWPASGEIDLIEARGNPGITGGADTVASTLHWGPTWQYFGDDLPKKPWTSTSKHAVDEFWKARDTWHPTWKGEEADLRVDWIRVWQD
ncbi:concanavalin A-like lectin/glucanase domain-containing protein [Pavlovales sp. CCMP2436]|nr:concanavalin A-like lectin/glucanase domain-containing protein [Pavlovales sp. CCMP2436]